MLLKFIGLIVALIIWVALLWLVLPFDFLTLSLPAIAALHVLPPIAVWLAWYIGWNWLKKRKTAALEAAEKNKIEERTHQRETEQKKFAQHLQDRRTFVECRWVSVIDLICQTTTDALPSGTEQTQFHSFTPAALVGGIEDKEWPAHAFIQVFDEMFSSLPIAASFPIQISHSSHYAAESIITLVKESRMRALASNNLEFPSRDQPEIFVSNNTADNAYNDIQNQFSSRRDWPGLVIIAFDKLWKPRDEFDDWFNTEQSHETAEEQQWHGSPSGAVCALIFTRQHLQAAVMQIEGTDGDVVLDHMLPHWDRQKIPAGISQHLSGLPAAWRQSLLEKPSIAHLHRPVRATIDVKETQATRIAKISQSIRDAAINAAMVEPMFEFEGEFVGESAADSAAPKFPLSDCSWLVHNAGTLSVCGDRLAMLTSALWENSIELNPIDQATNTAITFGDTGVASPWLQLALAIGHTATNNTPTLLAEFSNSSLWINLLSPPTPDA
jgi:hypothetical protein